MPIHDRKEVLAYISRALLVDEEDLSGEPQFGMTPGWDSMGHMNLMAALEAGLGIEIPLEELPTLTSATAILDYLEHNAAARP